MEKKNQGRIRHFGFSYHGTPEPLEQVLDQHPEIEFVQIQLNYADWNNPVVQSGKLYEILRTHQIPMIVMEPIKGGTLAKLSPELEAVLKSVRSHDSTASWAMRFAGLLDGVMTILSGMANQGQVEDNLAAFTSFEPLSTEARGLIDEVVKKDAGYAADSMHLLPLLLRWLSGRHPYPGCIPGAEYGSDVPAG